MPREIILMVKGSHWWALKRTCDLICISEVEFCPLCEGCKERKWLERDHFFETTAVAQVRERALV